MSDYEVLDITKEAIKTCDPKELVRFAVRLDRIYDKAKGVGVSIAERVHGMAHTRQKEFGIGSIEAVQAFTNDVMEMQEYIMSDEAGEYRVSELPKSIDQAFRKIVQSMKYGGDLTTLSSSNKCQVFNKKEKARLEEEEKERDRRAYLESMGIDPNSVQPQGIPSEAANSEGEEEGELSEIDQVMAKLTRKLKELDSLDHSRVDDMLENFTNKINNTLSMLGKKAS